MKDIIIVYPVKETALTIRNLIEKSGYHVSHICALGSTALEIASTKEKGVIICPSFMQDISASDLAEHLPFGFDVIALSKNGSEQYMGNLLTMPLPLDATEFVNTVGLLATSSTSITKRSDSDQEYIKKAKDALMAFQNMTEPQAHKYLQNESMISGKKIVEVAMDLLDKLG